MKITKEEIVKIEKEIQGTDVLDELVYDSISAKASEINNGGRWAQIKYLLDEGGFSDVEDILISINALTQE